MTDRLAALKTLTSPAYVADMASIRANLAVAARVKRETGCEMLLATKAFSMFSLFPEFAAVLDGTTASGLYEARLGHQHFKGAVHVYSPAYTEEEMQALLPIAGHIYFNSLSQLARFAPLCAGKHIGLRVNPGLSLVKNSALYDPSAPNSRFGVQPASITPDILAKYGVEILHIHNLCENLAEDSVALIKHIMATMPDLLHAVKVVNIGGGHYITHKHYDLLALIAAINRLKTAFDVAVVMEPGGALVYDAGYLATQVVDIIHNAGEIAILNTSATCHMPDVLEVPYTPPIIWPEQAKTGDEGGYLVTLAGKTCLTGDIIGEYRFKTPLKPGDSIIFSDMMQYSMVKNTTFNGMPLPAIGRLEENGTLEILKTFGYEDFENRLS